MDPSFENALVKFRASLTEKQRRDFALCTLKEVQIAIDEIQVRLGSERRLRSMNRIAKFIEAMTQLGQVVEIFLNVENAVAFVWAASTWVETLELLLDTYIEIGEILPGLTQFRNFLGQHPALKVHLENYYCDVLDFHRNALDVFSRPAWKTVFHSSWKTFKTRFGPILNSLKRHRALISDEKLTIAISEVRDFRSEVQDSRKFLEEKLEGLSKQMKELQLEEKEEGIQKLQEQRSRRLQFVLKKLDVADCQRDLNFLKHARRERRYHSSSGDWIFDNPLFQAWTDLTIARNSTLYLNGSPGSGKTILTSRVIEHLEQLRSYNSAQGQEFSVIYFYFNHMQPDKRTLTGLLLALLSQLIHQDDVLLEQSYQWCLAVDQQKVHSSDTVRYLVSVLLKSQRLCFVILDGLDECVGDPSANPTEEQEQVIDWFDDLTVDPESKESHTCKSCVRLFISGQRNGVLDKRLGMFLYAKIVLSNLLSQVSIYDFKQELKAEHFPKGLDEAWVPKLPQFLHPCFIDYVSSSEIRKHAITGYYGFQDYAAAFWWKHAHRVINTATDIDMDLYNKMLHAVARAMEAYGNLSNSLPEPGRCPTDAVQHHLQELADDAHEWENNFKIEFRTRAIRNTIEVFLTEEGASETHYSILTLYGLIRYKCHKPWCQSFYSGFERRQDRDNHLLEHDRPFRCCVEGCYGNEIGFPSESDLSRHTEKLHSTQPTIHFASPRALKSESRVICSAAATGDLAKVKACLLAGIPTDTSTKSTGGETPLYLAAKNGHTHICQYLLERGANVNFQGYRGHRRTALHAAALADDVELTHLLLSQPEVTPQLRDSKDLTAAGTAAKNGCNNALSAFISRGLASQSWCHKGVVSTCLSIAMDSGNLNTAELLINDTSLDLNKDYGERRHSKLPLHTAAKAGFVNIVKLLLSSGRVDVNKADLRGRRALHYACKNGHDSIVQLFLPIIDDHDARDDIGTTPFQYALEKGHAAVINLFLESGKVDANSKDRSGRTLLMFAIEKGHNAVVKLLLESGKFDANLREICVESKGNSGLPALWHAAEKRYEAIVKLLLEKGANIESMDRIGQTLLSRAAERGNKVIVKLLLEKGAYTESTDYYGRTPLMHAAERGYEAIAKLLLEKGANIESTDNDDWTPLTRAATNGHRAVFELLQSYEGQPS
ncbi:hypothetical protein DL770_008790 [Monosporascus sp. CRB-9-2]|nr:hypothetical protein DL770_008790 [Monosporascus sp. CRB-9-2]